MTANEKKKQKSGMSGMSSKRVETARTRTAAARGAKTANNMRVRRGGGESQEKKNDNTVGGEEYNELPNTYHNAEEGEEEEEDQEFYNAEEEENNHSIQPLKVQPLENITSRGNSAYSSSQVQPQGQPQRVQIQQVRSQGLSRSNNSNSTNSGRSCATDRLKFKRMMLSPEFEAGDVLERCGKNAEDHPELKNMIAAKIESERVYEELVQSQEYLMQRMLQHGSMFFGNPRDHPVFTGMYDANANKVIRAATELADQKKTVRALVFDYHQAYHALIKILDERLDMLHRQKYDLFYEPSRSDDGKWYERISSKKLFNRETVGLWGQNSEHFYSPSIQIKAEINRQILLLLRIREVVKSIVCHKSIEKEFRVGKRCRSYRLPDPGFDAISFKTDDYMYMDENDEWVEVRVD